MNMYRRGFTYPYIATDVMLTIFEEGLFNCSVYKLDL